MTLTGSHRRSLGGAPSSPAALVAIALTLTFLPRAAAAEKAAIRPEFQVSTYETYTYYGYTYSQAHNEGAGSVDIASDAAGTFVVAWEDLYEYGPGAYAYSIPGAFVRRIDSLGRPLGPEFRVSGLSSYALGGVAVASDPAGRFVVVWDDYFAESEDQSSVGIRGRRFNASAGVLGAPFLVNAYTTDDQFTPKVAMDTAGNFVVVWASNGYYSETYATIEGRRFDSTGTPGPQFQVNTTTCYFYGCAYSGFEDFARFDDMEIAANTAGNFMVVWRDQPPSASADIRGRVFDSTGAPTGPDFVVNTFNDPEYGRRAPAVAADGSGRFVVAWTDLYGSYIFARRFDSAGAALGGEFQVTTSAIYNYSHGPKVAADAAGRFVVTWDAWGNNYAVYAREFDSTGTPVAEPFRVDVAGDYYDSVISRHNIAASPAGQFVVVWGQYRTDSYTVGVDGRQIGDEPVACTPAPKTGCREQTVSNRGAFRFRDSAIESRRRLTWRWVKGQEVTTQALGDPRADNSIAFCVYDGSAAAQPLMDLRVPAGGGCTRLPCWIQIGTGLPSRFDYFDLARFVGGLELIRLHAKPEGQGRLSVLARKDNLDLPTTPLTAPVTVQMQAANGTCWTAEYGAHIRKNAGGVFVAAGS